MTSNFPVIAAPVVDKLTFLLEWATDCTKNEQRVLLQPVTERLGSAIGNGVCKKAYIEYSRYLQKFLIPFSADVDALVQIGSRDPMHQKGGISVTLNPSKLSEKDVRNFHKAMAHIVGSEYPDLIASPLLNRADFAVDISNVDIDDLLVRYNHAQTRTIFGKRTEMGAKIESYYFGSVSSDFLTCVYDKKSERVEKALENLLRNGPEHEALTENRIGRFKRERNSPEVVRVEVRGMKLRGCRPYDLWSLPNRFARFQFADLAHAGGPNLSEFDKLAFLALCRQCGVSAAIDLYARERAEVPVREYWKSQRAGWWKPESMWNDACNALRNSGIFPQSAFSQPEVPNLGRSTSKQKRR
ncbi:hypothetical protein [Paraburkholderia kururiensis]|uniref:hypothetical protein n=1 Tax=Paraburkholderia kururiensis TaxID=984307 RepID=UPI0012E0C1A8|nr:hypothetical protein [Paraburkholderia kururiensis]